jgi:hypothetical protein
MAAEVRGDETLLYFTQLEGKLNAFYITCVACKRNNVVLHTIGRRFVQEEILTMGKSTTKINLQQQIKYSETFFFR